MRITDNIRLRSNLSGMHNAAQKYFKSQQEVASGKKVTKPSDAPSAAREIMLTAKEIRLLERYQDSVTLARQKIALEEALLGNLEEMLYKAKEVAVDQASALRDESTRMQMKAMIDTMIDEAVAIARTRHGKAYLFSGTRTDTPPFEEDLIYQGSEEKWQIEIKKGVVIAPNHTGKEILIDSGVMDALQALSDALGSNDVEAIGDIITSIEKATRGIHKLISEEAVHMNRLETIERELESTLEALIERQSSLEDADLAESVNRLLAHENALQAAMLIISRAMNMNLASFI